jgi:hypothetical protein
MVEITNTTRRTRIFRNAAGAAVSLAPGETRDIEMTEVASKRYENFGPMRQEAGKEPELRPVLSFGKGKLAAAPPKPVQVQVTAPATKKKD